MPFVDNIFQPTHLLLVLVVALLVLGPKRLPEAGRAIGAGIRDFRSAMTGEQREPHDELVSQASSVEATQPQPQAEADSRPAAGAAPAGRLTSRQEHLSGTLGSRGDCSRERSAMVALLRTGKRPWVEYAELIEERGSAAAVLEEELAGSVAHPARRVCSTRRPRRTSRGGHRRLLAQAGADLDRWSAEGMKLVTVLDPDYPPNLRAVHDRPPMVFVAGNLTPADAHGIAVVGARKATHEGTKKAGAVAGHLVDSGFTVVSGLAAGIDTAAHTAALARGGRTVAVIGTGLARSYPPENQALQRRIASECAVISQLLPDPLRAPGAFQCATQ